jgi:predicted ester cyclase
MNETTRANKQRSCLLYEEIFGKGNYETADELMAPDIINHGPGVPPVSGTEGIKRQAALLRAAMPDLEVVLNDQVAEGDRVASRWTGRGTHTGPLNLPAGPVAATGNAISFDEIRIDRHADGRIVESWWIPDRFTFWAQLGLLRLSGMV